MARLRVSPARRVRVLVAALAVASAIRGAYVLRVEDDRPLVAFNLPDTEWKQAADWAAQNTPLDAHFLVDPWTRRVRPELPCGRRA